MPKKVDLPRRRAEMVRSQIAARGVQGFLVLAAMRRVQREAFVPPALVDLAYEDRPLPIAAGQTISQPYIVAKMVEAANVLPGSKVLEIGAGSGYAAAVLGEIAKEVFAIERHEELATSAAKRLSVLGYENVHILCADGTRGLRKHAPFDAIVVSAAGPIVPTSLLDQLAVGGRLVIPVGTPPSQQSLLRITKTSPTEHVQEDLGAVQFVPLVGAEGFDEETRLVKGGGLE